MSSNQIRTRHKPSDMSPPANKAELEITLGMVNYLSRFAPNLAKVCAPLGCLLRGETKFKLDKTRASVSLL